MDEPAQENQNDAAGGGVVAAAAGGGNGGGDDDGNVATAPAASQGNDGSNIEASAENSNANQNGEEAMDVDTAATAAAAAPSSRYSLRKRKPLLAVQGSNSTSAASGGNSNSNSNSAVPAAADPFGYVNTAALTDRQFEKMLAQYEEEGVRERAQKKLRLERGYGDDDYPYEAPPEGCPPFSSLPKEAIQLVFELLPSVRSVFNLAFQSKYMLSFVEERADIIVGAAVSGDALSSRSDNDEKKTLRVIMNEVRCRSIHVPSPLRLLRLLCAKRCERGANCWEYDLKTQLSGTEGVKAGVCPYGLALCKTCGKDVGHKFTYWNQPWREWEDKSKICIHRWSRVINFARAADILTTPRGELVGPIIEAKDLNQIHVSHDEKTASQNAYNQLLIECYGEEGSEERTSYQEECSEFVGLFDNAEEKLLIWLCRRENEKREKAREKLDEALAKKNSSIEPILTALEAAVADSPLKNLALDFRRQDVSSEAVRFRYYFMRDAMGKLIKAPSSATPKKMEAAFTVVKRTLAILSSSFDFFNLSFLSSAIEASTNSREKRILQKMLEKLRPCFYTMESVIGSHQPPRAECDLNKTNGRFFELLEQQDYASAVLHVMNARGLLKNVAASVLVSSTSANVYNHQRLARAVFVKIEMERPVGTDGTVPEYTMSSFQSVLTDVRRDFRILKTRARDYLNHQPVQDWVQGNENQAHYRHRRQDAANNVWYPRATVLNMRYNPEFIWPDIRGVTPYELLMAQDFDRLLQIHRFYYNWDGAIHCHYVPPANANS